MVGATHFEAGDLVQWPRPSVGSHIILLNSSHRHVYVVVAWAGVCKLDQGERRSADSGNRLQQETSKDLFVYFHFVLHCIIELVLCVGVCECILLPLPGFGIAAAGEAVQKFP